MSGSHGSFIEPNQHKIKIMFGKDFRSRSGTTTSSNLQWRAVWASIHYTNIWEPPFVKVTIIPQQNPHVFLQNKKRESAMTSKTKTSYEKCWSSWSQWSQLSILQTGLLYLSMSHEAKKTTPWNTGWLNRDPHVMVCYYNPCITWVV